MTHNTQYFGTVTLSLAPLQEQLHSFSERPLIEVLTRISLLVSGRTPTTESHTLRTFIRELALSEKRAWTFGGCVWRRLQKQENSLLVCAETPQQSTRSRISVTELPYRMNGGGGGVSVWWDHRFRLDFSGRVHDQLFIRAMCERDWQLLIKKRNQSPPHLNNTTTMIAHATSCRFTLPVIVDADDTLIAIPHFGFYDHDSPLCCPSEAAMRVTCSVDTTQGGVIFS